MPPTALAMVVDDRDDVRRILGERLIDVGFETVFADNVQSAFSTYETREPAMILIARNRQRPDVLELVRRLREVSKVPVVVIAASASIQDCEQAIRMGANRYLDFRQDLHRVGEVARELVEAAAREAVANRRAPKTATEARMLAQQELRSELERLLVECRGNIAEMARRMGKDRSTIRYHLGRLAMLDEEKPARFESPSGLSGSIEMRS